MSVMTTVKIKPTHVVGALCILFVFSIVGICVVESIPLWRSMIFTVFALAVSVSAFLLFLAVFRKSVSEPVSNLTETVRSVYGKRTLSIRADSLPGSETGVLADEFNTMLEAIHQSVTALREKIESHRMVHSVGQVVTSEMDLEKLLSVVIEQTNQIMGTERSTIFLHDDKTDFLWSFVATGMTKDKILIPTSYGIAGQVFNNREPLSINAPYSDPRFGSDIDKSSGFKTRNILCVPLINRAGKCIGVIQTLNKTSGPFPKSDSELLVSISVYAAIAIENARLYEDLKVLDKAKERVINHLAHELKTPLAVISVVFEQLYSKLRKSGTDKFDKMIERGRRNVRRLLALEDKIGDILNGKSPEEKQQIVKIIEDAASFMEEAVEERPDLAPVLRRIETLYETDEIKIEDIRVDEFLGTLCDEASMLSAYGRSVQIKRDFETGASLQADKNILGKICRGLLKNAIENTPDESEIIVEAKSSGDEIRIDIKDFGVGISDENQKMIFGGFIHTQDTFSYSSGTPYEFNAGGTGSDLLRMKVFSERFGFRIKFESTRCEFIPNDNDICPGRISGCEFVKEKSECLASGGSVFSVIFPGKA